MRFQLYVRQSLFLLLSFVLGACSQLSSGWQSEPYAEKTQTVLVTNINASELEKYLKAHGHRARLISERLQIYEVESSHKNDLSRQFASAVFLENTKFKWASEEVHYQMKIKLSHEEALKAWRSQMSGYEVVEAQKHALGENVVVAVIDSGVNTKRWDLKNNIWNNTKEIPNNRIDDDANGKIDDVNGWNFHDRNSDVAELDTHGTMSAGLIASSLTGVAPRAKIMPLRVVGEGGVSSFTLIAEAFSYAVENSADIVNISMGATGLSPEVVEFLKSIKNADVLVTNSAGNYAQSCRENPYTTSLSDLSNVLVVGALEIFNFKMARYSNYGDCVDLAAPAGAGSAEPDFTRRGLITSYPHSQDEFGLYHGTSAAAPVAAGVAALVKSKYPQLSGQKLAEHILKNSAALSDLNPYVRNGIVINAKRAVLAEPK